MKFRRGLGLSFSWFRRRQVNWRVRNLSFFAEGTDRDPGNDRDNCQHSCDRQRAANRPKPGIVPNIAQAQRRLCFFIELGGKFVL